MVMQLHYHRSMKNPFRFLGVSKLTDRFQTTIPAFVRQELGLNKRDLIEFLKSEDGYIVLGRREPKEPEVPEEFSPTLLAWLQFIEQDHESHPEQIKPLTKEMFDTALELSGGNFEIDLTQELNPEDELKH
jgi:antitoxin PrlF